MISPEKKEGRKMKKHLIVPETLSCACWRCGWG
jgi:hypothetical protein